MSAYIQETEERLSKKAALREQNLAVAKDRPELNTAMLDSSLKKNTAFIKKLVRKQMMSSPLSRVSESTRNLYDQDSFLFIYILIFTLV